MMLRYMMFTYDITYEVWYMISHVNLAEDHIRFSHEMRTIVEDSFDKTIRLGSGVKTTGEGVGVGRGFG